MILWCRYYLSPELCADMPYRDKSDCWALGVLVYEVRQLNHTVKHSVLACCNQPSFLVLFSQCATLQHPFEARNQCALIMKIIEAQVKIPSSTVISTEMRNTILWLLQKDPNARPSIRHILNEVRPLGTFSYFFSVPHSRILNIIYYSNRYARSCERISLSCPKSYASLASQTY